MRNSPAARKLLRPPSSGILRAGVQPRELWAWAMYDFANSGYTTVIITAMFNAYFVAVVAGNAQWATFAWTAALACSYGLVVLSAPVIGAYADLKAAKKKLLAASTAGCVLFTALLYFAQPGALALAILCLVASNFFFCTGENLIAAFLPEISQARTFGRVSSWGWSLGYIGGILTLAVCMAYVSWAQGQGRAAAQFVPVTMLLTAGIFALASLPTFLLLRERAKPAAVHGPIARQAWRRVWQTLRSLHRFADLRLFLLCSLFYQAGIQAVISLAAIYMAQALGYGTRQILLLILLVNIMAAAGACLFGLLQDRIGHVRTIALTLAGWIITVLLAWAAREPAMLWAAANTAGLCMGASQSAGRAMIGVLAPPSRSGEFFGLWGLSVRLAAMAGPLTYGTATWFSGGDHRRALLITGVYFVIGLILLAGVDAQRGRRSALRSERLDSRSLMPAARPPAR